MKNQKIKTLPGLLRTLKQERRGGKKIVFTNGCFDILHRGHVQYLQRAREKGDWLVIGMNSDHSVKKIKGPHRPINSQKDRAEVLAALECVNSIIIFSDDTPLKLIEAIRPDVLVKGADWKMKDIVGADLLRSYGGRVIRINYLKGYSTTNIIKEIGKG